MREISFYNEFHLGDNLLQLLWMRKVAEREDVLLRLFCKDEYHTQLREVIADLPNIHVLPLRDRVAGAHCCWIGKDNAVQTTTRRFNGFTDFTAFYIDWYGELAAVSGVENPVKLPRDMLFDYPALTSETALSGKKFDFLVVNSSPMSGQFTHIVGDFDDLFYRAVDRGHSVVCTQPSGVPGVECTADYGLTVTGIGAVSALCTNIVCINTGPMWPTFNVLHTPAIRCVLDTNHQPTHHASEPFRTCPEVVAALESRGIL